MRWLKGDPADHPKFQRGECSRVGNSGGDAPTPDRGTVAGVQVAAVPVQVQEAGRSLRLLMRGASLRRRAMAEGTSHTFSRTQRGSRTSPMAM